VLAYLASKAQFLKDAPTIEDIVKTAAKKKLDEGATPHHHDNSSCVLYRARNGATGSRLSLTDRRTVKSSGINSSVRHRRTDHICISQVRALEVRARQVRARQVRERQFRVRQFRVRQVREY